MDSSETSLRRNEMKKIVIAIIACASMSAFAWGPREQGALAGFVAGALINQQLNEDRREPVYVQPTPLYSYPQNPVYQQPYVIRPEPRVIVCQDYQNYDHYGRPYGIQRVCR
jgi:hypothetical protein